MKLKEKISIDLEEFLTTGKFDFIKLGKTKEWILNNFADPDGYEEHPKIIKDDVWTYGNIEFHFYNNKLFLIFSDNLDILKGGKSLTLKKWILESPEKLTLNDMISALNNKHIDFHKKTNKMEQLTVQLILESGVNLGFALEQHLNEDYEDFLERCQKTNQDKYILCSFSLNN
ncbi:hypothetical protein [Flammeovirga sp. EKP202]|uniref:hypothetical protein n=1 Tax=Flammeovirga sp. EKP202 TaxID=2770592 RepID=UPI00165F38AA|nr:hypothetical protein [Flammeovirga sp. EKP202]MBD0404064.1 hypothetical protein [Flammeovirga sp. EKP202]